MWPRAKHLFYSELYTFVMLFLTVLLLCTPAFSAPLARELEHAARVVYYRNVPPNARGHYNYEFQTTNGITTKAAGNEHGAVGVVQYVSLEGIPVTWTYVADANGYHPEGEHLPQTPLHVHRALEYIRTHPSVDEKKSRRF